MGRTEGASGFGHRSRAVALTQNVHNQPDGPMARYPGKARSIEQISIVNRVYWRDAHRSRRLGGTRDVEPNLDHGRALRGLSIGSVPSVLFKPSTRIRGVHGWCREIGFGADWEQ